MKPKIYFIFVPFIILLSIQLASAQDSFYLEEISVHILASKGEIDTVNNRMWVSGDKFRREMIETGDILIGRLDKGVFWQIDTADSSYTEIDAETMRSFALMGLYMMGLQSDDNGNIKVPKDLYTKTGRTKKINGWDTFEMSINPKYAKDSGIAHVSLWISRQVQLPAKIYSDMMRKLFGNPTGEVEKLFDIWSGFEGYPVMVETSAMGITNINKLVKIERKDIPADKFELPEGFKKTE